MGPHISKCTLVFVSLSSSFWILIWAFCFFSGNLSCEGRIRILTIRYSERKQQYMRANAIASYKSRAAWICVDTGQRENKGEGWSVLVWLEDIWKQIVSSGALQSGVPSITWKLVRNAESQTHWVSISVWARFPSNYYVHIKFGSTGLVQWFWVTGACSSYLGSFQKSRYPGYTPDQ